MRTAAKVFIWFGIIFGFYLIYPLIVGIIALKKLSHCNSKQELQNFGIVALFFCSFLGGLFMMLVDDISQNTHCENTDVITYQTSVSNEKLRHINTETSAKITRICVLSLAVLSVICLVLSILIVVFPSYYYYYNEYYAYVNDSSMLMAAIPIWCNTAFVLIPTIFYLCTKRQVNKSCEIVFIIYAIYSIVLFTLTFIAAMFTLNDYRSAHIWIAALLSFVILILSLTVIIINRKVFKAYKKVKVVKTKLEIELDKIKQLFDSNIVTQTEYEKMRQTIIEKYYSA